MRRFVLVLLAIPLISGCGGVDGSLFATAVRTTESAGGAEVAYQWNYDVPGRDSPVVMLGSGVEDVTQRHAHIEAQLPSEFPGGGDIEAVGDDDVIYMRAPFMRPALAGKEWMKLDLGRAYESLGVELDALGQVGKGSYDQLGALREVSDGVQDEGRQVVRGIEATHYSARVDFDKLPGERLQKLAKLSGDTHVDIDVWIEDSGRIRRMEWAQRLPNGVRMTMIMEYVRFGVPVHIENPDEGDVFDVTDATIQELQQELN